MSSKGSSPLFEIFEAARWRWRSLEDLKEASLFTKANYINFILLILFILISVRQTRRKLEKAEKAAADSRFLSAKDFPDIETLEDFSLEAQKPLKMRTFKPKYHLTMALEKLNPSELILMDQNYVNRIAYRKGVMMEHHEIAIGVNNDEAIGPAVRELYTWLMGSYLPKRYPTVFKLHKTQYDVGVVFMLENLVTKEISPAIAKDTAKTITLLETLGRHLDEEFLFLLPEVTTQEGQEPRYVLEAYVNISPSGFNTRKKLGLRLSDIHEPVPGYAKTIEASMDRYFAKLQAGEYVKRANWSITLSSELFSPGDGTNHAHEGDILQQLESIDPDKTYLRCERQTLQRLPVSHAIVFSFKTHMYPIKEIKEEGSGEDLARAIDGLREGNTPGMHFYKRGAVWGEAVKAYLRS